MPRLDVPAAETSTRTSLAELAGLFLRLGTTAFGGPAAHIAMMRDEVVHRRKWMTDERFLDLLGATNLIPGPNSTEMAIHIGHARRGFPGLVVAGLCFILPAALIVTAIAWAYTEYGALPAVVGVMAGIKPVILAIVVQAIWNLGKTALKTNFVRIRHSYRTQAAGSDLTRLPEGRERQPGGEMPVSV